MRGTTRFHKTVHFFLMRPIGGALEEHDAEFDEVRWIDIDEALAILTHATERIGGRGGGGRARRAVGRAEPMAGAEATA